MADGITIESIAIEITASAEKADQALEKLMNSLERLKTVCQGGLDGADKTAKNLKKIAEAAQSFEGVNAEKLNSVARALQAFQNIGNLPDLSAFARAMNNLSTAANGINSTDMSALATNIQAVAAAVQPLTAMQGIGDLSAAINALNKLPTVAKGLSQMDLGTFARQMQEVTNAVQPFVTQMQTLSAAFSSVPAPIQQAVANIMNYNTATQQANQGTRSLSKSLKLINFMAIYTVAKRVVSVFGEFVESSNMYVENLNLFSVTMGEATDEALKFANTVNSLMGIDISQWIENQGIFKQMVSGFGLVEEKANLVSKNLTQLGYDISSYYNISVESAMQKLQSGLAGEQEPLRRLGYSLDQATLKQVALNHGIETSLNDMSQAQKAQLRYIAIIEQSANAMGDMARTIDSPANQLRILESRIDTLKRAIGDSLMPVISAALPYVTAFVQILGETFRNIAEFMGFELPVFDYSDLKKETSGIAEGFDEATAASNKFKGTLAGIDQLNIIGSKSDTSGGVGDMFGDLNLDLPSYDFLGNLKEETNAAYETLKKFLSDIAPVVTGIAATLGALFIGDKFVKGVQSIVKGAEFLLGSKIGKVATTIATTTAAFLGFKNVVKDLTTGNGNLNNLALAIGGVSAAIAIMAATGNPIGALVTLLGAGAGAFVGWIEGQKELNNQLAEAIIYADNGGIAIDGLVKGYGNYFDTISSGYNDILNTTNALKDNRDRAADVAVEILNVTDKYRDLGGTMSGADGEAIKQHIKDLGDLATTYIDGVTTNAIVTLQEKFSETAQQMGIDIDGLSGKLKLLQGFNNTAMENFAQQADELVAALTSGNLSADEFQNALNQLDEVTRKMSLPDITAESLSFTRALEEMQTAAVNFSDADALAAMEELGTKADAARAKLQEAQINQLTELENYRQLSIQTGAAADFDLAMKDQGIDYSFEQMFADLKETLEQGYATELNKIDLGEAVFYAQIQGQLDTNADKYIEEKLRETVEKTGMSMDEAKERLKEGIWGENLYDRIIDEYKSTDAFKELQTVIDENISGLKVDNAEEIGRMLIEGMANGVIDGQEDFFNALNEAAIGGLDALKKALDEHSPSKKAESISKFLMEGLEIGVDKNAYLVIAALDDTALAMERVMKDIEFDAPSFTDEDISRAFGGAYMGFQSTSDIRHSGVDSQAVGDAGRALSDSGVPININMTVQSYVDLDGEQVGQATAQYQQRQMAYSNGR